MTAGWGWSLRSASDLRRNAGGWVAPFVAASPWITLGVLLLMLHLAGGTLAAARGVLFDLPDEHIGEGDRSRLVALVLPMAHETLVFFDDARYVLGDDLSLDAFSEQLAERARKLDVRTLLVLADRRVTGGEMMRLARAARQGGAERILFAEKRQEPEEE